MGIGQVNRRKTLVSKGAWDKNALPTKRRIQMLTRSANSRYSRWVDSASESDLGIGQMSTRRALASKDDWDENALTAKRRIQTQTRSQKSRYGRSETLVGSAGEIDSSVGQVKRRKALAPNDSWDENTLPTKRPIPQTQTRSRESRYSRAETSWVDFSSESELGIGRKALLSKDDCDENAPPAKRRIQTQAKSPKSKYSRAEVWEFSDSESDSSIGQMRRRNGNAQLSRPRQSERVPLSNDAFHGNAQHVQPRQLERLLSNDNENTPLAKPRQLERLPLSHKSFQSTSSMQKLEVRAGMKRPRSKWEQLEREPQCCRSNRLGSRKVSKLKPLANAERPRSPIYQEFANESLIIKP